MSNPKVKALIKEYQYEIGIFIYLLFNFYVNRPKEITGWMNSFYAIDYSFGYGPRMLIGTIMNVISNGLIRENVVFGFVIVNFIIFFLMLAMCLGYALRTAGNSKLKIMIALIILFYFASPTSPEYLYSKCNVGRMELYQYILVLVAVIVSIRSKSIWLKTIVEMVTIYLSMSMHESFIFLSFPIYFVMVIRDFERAKECDKRKAIISGICVILTFIVSFILFYAVFKVHASSADEIYAQLSNKTDYEVNELPIYYEYFATLKEHYEDFYQPAALGAFARLVMSFFLISPIILLQFKLCKTIWKMKKEKIQTVKYVFILLSFCSYLPAFLVTIDWGRWCGCFGMQVMLVMVYLAISNDKIYIQALESQVDFVKRNWIWIVLAIVFIAQLDKFDSLIPTTQIDNLWNPIDTLKDNL